MDPSRNGQPPSPRQTFTLNTLAATHDYNPHDFAAAGANSIDLYGTSASLASNPAQPSLAIDPSSSISGRQPVMSRPDHAVPMSTSGSAHESASNGNGDPGPFTAIAAVSSKAENGPSRKQNVACDACRTKKIRCRRTIIAENCEQCTAKGATCTSNYIEQLQAKAKKGRQLKGTTSGEDSRSGSVIATAESVERPSSGGIKRKRSGAEEEVDREQRRGSTASQPTPLRQSLSLPRYYQHPARPPSDLRPSEKQANLVRYMLSPTTVTHHHLGYSDLGSMESCEAGSSDVWEEQSGRVWSEEPSEAHAGLTDVGTRELADDLVDSFSSLVHPRFSLLDLGNFRARLSAPDTHPDGPVPHNLLAIAIAFGGRFSDHSIVNLDREECMTRDETESGRPGRIPPRSRLVQLLVIRAREVVEVQKTHRIPSLVNVQVLLLLEFLLGQSPFLEQRYTRYNHASAVRHVDALGYNDSKKLARISDEKERASAVFTWSFLCCCDGFQSAMHRVRPSLSESSCEMADFDFAHTAGMAGINDSSPSGGAKFSVASLGAIAAGSAMCRQLCVDLWHPRVPETGIPLAALEKFISACSSWRDNFLTQLGIPSQWPDGWNFDAIITACSSDARHLGASADSSYYHALWLVVEHAVKDYGILELRAPSAPPGMVMAARIEAVRKRIREEAAHGALRITSLTSTLAINQYLRVDPLILAQPIYEAGLFLADQPRQECMIAVAGLRQYCIPYPQFWSRAEEIERLFQARQSTSSSAYSRPSNNAPVPSVSSSLGTSAFCAPVTEPFASTPSSASSVSTQLPHGYATLNGGMTGLQGGQMGGSAYPVVPSLRPSIETRPGPHGSFDYGRAQNTGGAGNLMPDDTGMLPGSGGMAAPSDEQVDLQKEISMALFEWLHAP